jgi:CspA family cold shock protein
MIGKVVWFSNQKGFGFLQDSATQKEYFCHYSAIHCEGYKKLEPEQKVEFDVEIGQSSGKEQAANVVVVG